MLGYRIYGIILIFQDFSLIPSVVKIKEMLIPLIWSIFSISLGLYYYFTRKTKKVKETSFDKATAKLFNGYKDMPSAKIIITEDKIHCAKIVGLNTVI